MPPAPFLTRVHELPKLGLGISTEYGARAAGGLNPLALARRYPMYAGFLEVGVEADRGLDRDAKRWRSDGRRTTYHFLDVNLDDPADYADAAWLDRVRAHIEELRPAWLCGDAGLWHFGPRERGHMLLLPPILTQSSVHAMSAGIVALRAATGCEVLPENPPGQVFVGDMHLLDFYAALVREADTGMLLDLSHLAIYQRLMGHAPDARLADFPLDRIVEVHIAGGVERDCDGFAWVEDAHGADVLPEVWSLFEWLVPRAPNLKAVVFECERNTIDVTLPGFERIHAILGRT